MVLILLRFLGSGFVPVHFMPDGLRWFAENQPFTPTTDTVRRTTRARAVHPGYYHWYYRWRRFL